MARDTHTRSFVLRVDAETLDALESWAEDEFRSINGQLQWIIADALRRYGRFKHPRAAAPRADAPEDRPETPAISKKKQTNRNHEAMDQ